MKTADIYGNVKHFALHNANKLALRMRRQLIVHAPQHPLVGLRVIVLHKGDVVSDSLLQFSVEALEEEAAFVLEHSWLNDFHFWNLVLVTFIF